MDREGQERVRAEREGRETGRDRREGGPGDREDQGGRGMEEGPVAREDQWTGGGPGEREGPWTGRTSDTEGQVTGKARTGRARGQGGPKDREGQGQ